MVENDSEQVKTQAQKKIQKDNTEKLEDLLLKTLKTGIIKEVNGKTIPSFPDYKNEIKEYKQEASHKKKKLPFVNQEKTFLQLVRTLSTSYPYAVLVGKSGIGKSMILDYVLNILTGKVSLEEVKETVPEAEPLLKKIIENTTKFEHRKYLLVPNLQDPFNVNTISYTNQEELEKDIDISLSFCNEVSNFLKNYLRFKKDDIRLEMDEEEFRKNIKSKIHFMHIDLLEEISKNMKVDEKNDSMKEEPVALLRFELPQQLFKTNKKVKARIEIIGKERLGNKTAEKNREIIRHKKELLKEGKEMMNELLYSVSITEIKGKTQKEKNDIFKEEFEDYINRTLSPLYEECAKGKIRNQQLLLATMLPKIRSHQGEKKISDKTIDEVIETLQDFRDEYITGVSHESLKKWMDSVVKYFKSERKIIEENLLEMIRYDERENRRIRDEYRKKRKKEDFRRFANKILKKIGEQKNAKPKLEEKEGEEEKLERKYWSSFMIPHGNSRIDVGRIMTVEEHGYEFPTSKGVTYTKLGNFDPETLFGEFNIIEEEDFEEESATPPHLTIKRLGPFFKSGLVIFPDSFKRFIETITANYIDTQNMKEQFLEYLQTGILTVTKGDISYTFEAPKIILGCDNEDPFEITDGTIFIRDEVGFRGRIKTINVPDLATNNKETRKGSIRVLYEAIEKYLNNSFRSNSEDNKTHKGNNEKKEKSLLITDEAATMLLLTTMYSERLLSLEYRKFTSKIEEICAYAVSKRKKEITSALLKEHIKDQIPPYFFYYVDCEEEYDGYFYLPEKQAGHVNGLSVFHNAPAEIVKIKSYFKPGLDDKHNGAKHFELIDIESNMTDETAIKGYELAKDLVASIIAKAQVNGALKRASCDWQLKTHFDGKWEGAGGPSASLAIALSMVSALADEPVYRNRFVTGTVEPSSQKVGAIGGTYYKALIPMRIKELLSKRGEEEEVYFLFPAPNMKDLTRDIIFDPFELEKKVVCLPVTSFTQAYHLVTCGPFINESDWKHAQKFGEEKLEEAVKRIYKKFN